jgi:protein-S-isoprenylcysteine O-methyltransferase Ste14
MELANLHVFHYLSIVISDYSTAINRKKMKESARYITGYLIGFIVFIILIPTGFYKLSQLDYLFHGRVLIGSEMLKLFLTSVFFIPGIIFAIWSNYSLYKTGKGGPVDAFGVSVSPQTKILVTSGPYRYCRNPMMFGALSIYTSIVIYLNSFTGLIGIAILIILAILLIKQSEEKRMVNDFGNEYLEYRKKVPMLFPVTFRRKR